MLMDPYYIFIVLRITFATPSIVADKDSLDSKETIPSISMADLLGTLTDSVRLDKRKNIHSSQISS